jgi:hypothetical protein
MIVVIPLAGEMTRLLTVNLEKGIASKRGNDLVGFYLLL